MKKQYSIPQAVAENFVPNRVIADCTSVAKTMDFYCLQGKDIDQRQDVMISGTSSCKLTAGLAENVIGAVKLNSNSGSTGTKPGSLLSSNGKTYSGRILDLSGTKYDSVLYFCIENKDKNPAFSVDQWSTQGDVLVHNGNTHGNYHCQVLGVNSATVSNS